MVLSAMRLLNTTISFLRAMVVMTVSTNIANVVVLTPPAVEPEVPPINISIYEMTVPPEDRSAWSTDAKPAVLSVVD